MGCVYEVARRGQPDWVTLQTDLLIQVVTALPPPLLPHSYPSPPSSYLYLADLASFRGATD